MTTYPLLTLACSVTQDGISAPSYSDILLSLQASYRGIFGADTVLDESTQDGQWLAIQALAQHDSNNATILTYNQFSPKTAVGAGLSSVVKINGISRLVPTNSTCDVLIIGRPGTLISGGIVGDNIKMGTRWALPALVGIPIGGAVTVTSTSTTPGSVSMAAGVLTVMLTPTAGWQSVTNAASAATGNPIERDADLRMRQSKSTMGPGQSQAASSYSALGQLPGVIAVSYINNTASTPDANGIPGHTIAWVIQGGDSAAIGAVIGFNKGVGAGTFGATSQLFIDPVSGRTETVYFSRPTLQTISVAITIKALAGYNNSIGIEIEDAVAAYLSSLTIGVPVLLTRLQVPAQLAGPFGNAVAAFSTDAGTYEVTALAIAIAPAGPAGADLPIAWNQRATCSRANVVLSVT